MLLTTIASLVNSVSCNKRVLWNQGDRSARINDEIFGNKTIFNSPASLNWQSLRADDNSHYGTTDENEEYTIGSNTYKYYHGEYDYHMYSSSMGYDPAGNTTYANTKDFITADDNEDNIISIIEAYDWEYDEKTVLITGFEQETTFADIGNNGPTTSLDWPTLLHTTYPSSKSWKGLIGISKDFHVLDQCSLTFEDNSIVHFINDADLTIDIV